MVDDTDPFSFRLVRMILTGLPTVEEHFSKRKKSEKE